MPTSIRRNHQRGGQPLPPPRWGRVARLDLIRREFREFLPGGAVDLLFTAADWVVEGSPELTHGRPGPAGTRVYATMMMTIDLLRLADCFREPADAATAVRVAELMRNDPRVRGRLEAKVRPELATLAEVPPVSIEVFVDTTVRADGTSILIDIDAMGSLSRAGAR